MKKSVLITDLDDTLFDWFGVWHASFTALLDQVVKISGIDKESLTPQIRGIHQKHGTSEYLFLLEEIQLLKEHHNTTSNEKILEIYAPAIQAYREARDDSLKLYPYVYKTLNEIKDTGATIIAYTDSLAYYTNYRIRKLELEGIIDYIYSSPDHDVPKKINFWEFQEYHADEYDLKGTIHRHTPKGKVKPNPDMLRKIMKDIGVNKRECVYVGDHPQKDVFMAQEADVDHAFAEYGRSQNDARYDLLRAVSHWTDEDVEFERNLRLIDVKPQITLKESFDEIFDHFEF